MAHILDPALMSDRRGGNTRVETEKESPDGCEEGDAECIPVACHDDGRGLPSII